MTSYLGARTFPRPACRQQRDVSLTAEERLVKAERDVSRLQAELREAHGLVRQMSFQIELRKDWLPPSVLWVNKAQHVEAR